jgi:hypothetical protein
MISEKEFANGFAGFWSEATPFLTSRLVTEVNMSGSPLGGRRFDPWAKPLSTPADSSNNDVLAETAFGLFAEAIRSRRDVLEVSADKGLLKRLENSALDRIWGLRGAWSRKERSWKTNKSAPNTAADQSIELARRLELFFKQNHHDEVVIIQPPFQGCGILNSCNGDVLAGKCLYELKTVDRNLRSSDIKQVLIYCVLNRYSRQYEIDSFTILNPRRGLEFHFDLESFSQKISGKTAAELFHEVAEFLCDFAAVHKGS